LKIFVAGATGVIGRSLVPLLIKAGHEVTGTTRSADKASLLERAGAKPIVVDVYEAAAFARAMRAEAPDVVIHQLTDLPDVMNPAARAETTARNARLRKEGTRNLMAAAQIAGARRVVAQSIAFAYARGQLPHSEGDLLDLEGPSRTSTQGVIALERAVMGAAPRIDGIVLRYGRLYGPGTWSETRASPPALHVDAAAQAALLAVTHGEPGIYNVAEDDGAVTTDKAKKQLGFDPAFRIR
jgi:nucleoside-diphosphate-sugar epimerase